MRLFHIMKILTKNTLYGLQITTNELDETIPSILLIRFPISIRNKEKKKKTWTVLSSPISAEVLIG